MRLPAVVHVDLDGAAEIYEAHGWPWSGGGDPLFESGMRHALDFFASHGVRATLFVIARQLDDPRKREWIREAVRQGHEIASHTVTHASLTRLERGEKRREIFESRDRLAADLGVEVRGFRAPQFHIDRESLELIAEAGYSYDSSLFPGHAAQQKPHRPFAGRDLIELSLPSAAPLPFPFHPCYSLVLGIPYYRLAFARFRLRRAPLVFLFHLTDFADPVPESRLNGWADRIYTLSHLSARRKQRRCGKMLDAVREHFRIVTTNELVRAI
jgi:hypothetical protein